MFALLISSCDSYCFPFHHHYLRLHFISLSVSCYPSHHPLCLLFSFSSPSLSVSRSVGASTEVQGDSAQHRAQVNITPSHTLNQPSHIICYIPLSYSSSPYSYFPCYLVAVCPAVCYSPSPQLSSNSPPTPSYSNSNPL